MTIIYLLLTACGGDSEAPEAHESNSQDLESGYRLELALFNAATDEPTTSISGDSPAEILVTVTRFGAPSVSQLVSIATDLGSVDVSNGTLLTDSSGEARVNLLADSNDGAGTITASITIGTSTLTTELNFASSGGDVAVTPDSVNIALSLQSESGIANTVSSTDPGTLSISVTNQNGEGIANTLLTLSGNLVSFSPEAGTALTDENGLASIQVLAGNVAGIATLLAQIGTGEDAITEDLNINVIAVDENATAANEAVSQDVQSGYTLELALFDAESAVPTTAISSTSPGQIRVRVSQLGAPSVNQLVSISSDLGSIGVSNGTLLTDNNGEARVNILAEGLDGAGTITASISVDGDALSAQLNFASSGSETSDPDSTYISLSLLSESGVINTIRGDDPGILNILVTNKNGEGIANTLINLSGTLVSFNPSSATALTDDDGRASIGVVSGESTGIATITASIGEEEAAISESLNITIAPPSIKFGNGLDGAFVEGQLNPGLDTLSAGGTVSISASVVNSDNSAFTTPLDITFSSTCVEEGLASIDSNVSTINGLVTSTYRADGCVGTDTVTAVLSFSGTQYVATTDITVQSDAAGSIVFTEASPTTIVLRGAGGQGLKESSTVRFQVFGAQGLALPNQQVDFSLTTEVGGLTLSPSTALSDAEGFVSTSVQSGNVATSVVVIATLTEAEISSQSASLVVSTGVPDQDSLSISLSPCVPEGWNHDGIESTVTVRAADSFNNTVPDGVSFAFSTEGGSIGPSCISQNGACTVTWTSQSPRPSNGISSVMVSSIGSESFQDENGNGRFDDGDTFNDLPEAFRDDNNDGVRDSGEPYIDFNLNGSFDTEDSLFGGPLCEDTARCSPLGGVTVRDEANLIMAGSRAFFTYSIAEGSLVNSLDTFSVNVADINNNAMPSGTTISIETTIGVLLSATEPFFSDCERNPKDVGITLDLADVDPPTGTGFINITVTTPLKIETFDSFRFTY